MISTWLASKQERLGYLSIYTVVPFAHWDLLCFRGVVRVTNAIVLA